MNNFCHQLNTFLLITSMQILILGAAALFLVKVFRIRGAAAQWIFRLVVFLPLLYPLGSLIPLPSIVNPIEITQPLTLSDSSQTKIPKPITSNYFQTTQPLAPGNILPQESTDTPSTASVSSPENTVWVSPYSHTVDAKSNTQASPKASLLSTLNWTIMFAILWFIGVFLCLIRSLCALTAQLRLVRGSKPVIREDIRNLLAQCAALLRLKRFPKIAQSPVPCIPFLSCALRPFIILPAILLEPDNRDGLRYTLLHELAHYKRRDFCWLLAETMLGVFYFFHPFVYVLRKQIEREREALCDRDVVNATEQAIQYADFLLEQVWQSSRRIQSACAIPMLGKTSTVARRIQEILINREKTCFSTARNAAALCLTIFALIPLLSLGSQSTNQGSDRIASYQSDLSSLNSNQIDKENSKNNQPIKDIGILTFGLVKDVFTPQVQEDLFPDIDGKVVDANTGEPLSGVEIRRLRPAEYCRNIPENNIRTDYTNSTGAYTLAPPHSGAYKMVALKEGYAPSYFTLDVPTPVLNQAGRLVFEQPFESALIRMTPSPLSVKAIVHYPKECKELETIRFLYIKDGFYHPIPISEIPNPDGVYTLSGIAPGEAAFSCIVMGDPIYRSDWQKSVIESDKPSELEFNLTPRMVYTITLAPFDKKPIGFFEIKIPEFHEINPDSLCYDCFEENQFRMELPPQNLQVTLKAPGYKTVQFDPLAQAKLEKNKETQELSRGSLEILLEPSASDSGAPLGGFKVGGFSPPVKFERAFEVGKTFPVGSDRWVNEVQIIPRLKKIAFLFLVTSNETNHPSTQILKENRDWTYDPQSHKIKLAAPIDTEKQFISVQGIIDAPYVWKTRGPIVPGSVEVYTTAPIQLDALTNYYQEKGLSLQRPALKTDSIQSASGYYMLDAPGNPSASYVESPTMYFYTMDSTGKVNPASPDIASSSNCLIITDRLAIRGVDYEVNEKEGLIYFLKKEDCYPHLNYHIYYSDYSNPTDPGLAVEHDFGSDPDISIIRERFWRRNQPKIQTASAVIPEATEIPIPMESTHDPTVYTTSYFLKKETLRVSVVSRNDYKLVKELIPGEDYEYDPERSLVKLLKSNLLDRSKDILLVNAEPRYESFIFHHLKLTDSVSVSVEDFLLQLGKDYTVDYAAGTIRLASAERIQPGTRFRIDAGNQTLLSSK